MLFDSIQIANNEDISTGKSVTLKTYLAMSLYINTSSAINITIELSPDGTTWYEIPEGAIPYTGASEDIIEFGYISQAIRLTGSNTTNVTAYILGSR